MTYKSCNKHRGMKVAYETEEYRNCLLCAKELQSQFLISALKEVLDLGSLHIEVMKLMLKSAPQEQQRDLMARSHESANKASKDINRAFEAVSDAYV